MDEALRSGAIILGKYRIDRVLGQGGMGVVLKVTHVQLGEELAIKILLPHGAAQTETHARFLREARSVARLRGEHVARMADVGVLPDGSPYMLMEYLHGIDLAVELQRRRTLPVGEAVDYALQACAALAEAHANGIVHRDIKPGNLFLTTRLDGTPLVKVLDFGISKDPSVDGEQLTQTQTMMGTPGYMSPEHMKATKEVDARTDLWSLGVVLYECLNGRRPFLADSFSAVVIKVATEKPEPMARSIPDALQRVVLRCLEKDRNARWATAAELAASLAPFARDVAGAARAVEQAQVLGRAPRARTAPVVAAQPLAPRQTGQRRVPAATLSGSARASRGRPRRQWAYGRIAIAVGVLVAGVVGGVALAMHDWTADQAAPVVVAAPVAMKPVAPVAMEPIAPTSVAPTPTPAVAPVPEPAVAELAVAAPAEPAPPSEAPAAEPAADTAPRPAPARPASPCDTINLGDTMATAANSYAGGSARSALALVTKALDCRHSDNMYRLAGIYACAAFDARAAKLYYGKTSPQLQPQIAQKCRQTGLDLGIAATAPAAQVTPAVACNTISVDDVMSRASSQYAGGNPKLALSLAQNALACQQNSRMYWLATLYACGAGDPLRARQYFRKVPVEIQAKLVERCTQHHISLP